MLLYLRLLTTIHIYISLWTHSCAAIATPGWPHPGRSQFLVATESHSSTEPLVVFEEMVVYLVVYPRKPRRDTLSIQLSAVALTGG
jgi:hypothetical protein